MARLQVEVRAHLRVEGAVQGVFFRASAVARAHALGLTGWVMNCHDGAVEAVAEGTRSNVEEFIAWCRRGPSGATVSNVDVRWESPRRNLESFSIKR